MKRLLFLFLAGAMLMMVSISFAQMQPTNLMGLSAKPEWIDFCAFGPGFQVYTTYLFIQNPVNPDFMGGSHPVSWIGGFECRLWIEGDANVLAWNFPVDAINAGTNGNTVVGFAEPVPVTNGWAVVAILDIFLGYGIPVLEGEKGSPLPCDDPTAIVRMAPTRPASSIEGMVSFLDADDPDDPLVGATVLSAYLEEVVLLMESYGVDVENQTWGGIKAIYR